MSEPSSSDTDGSQQPHGLRMRLRLKADQKLILGPGRLDLLDGIEATGSISAAARGMKMSYRRAWLLVDDVNHCFREPLVESVSGGKRGGGARLTPFGKHVMETYRHLLQKAERAISTEKTELATLLAETFPEDKNGETAK